MAWKGRNDIIVNEKSFNNLSQLRNLLKLTIYVRNALNDVIVKQVFNYFSHIRLIYIKSNKSKISLDLFEFISNKVKFRLGFYDLL